MARLSSLAHIFFASKAEKEIPTSETYQPLAPGVPLTVAVVVKGALAAKLAVIVWLAVTSVTVSGLSVVAAKPLSPVQFTNL